jgi:hypothetical protein
VPHPIRDAKGTIDESKLSQRMPENGNIDEPKITPKAPVKKSKK